MNTAIALLIALLWLWVAYADRWVHPMPYQMPLLLLPAMLPAAVVSLLYGAWQVGIVEAGISGWMIYIAWKRRPPRKRKPSKVLGRIVDLGHRLQIAPELAQ